MPLDFTSPKENFIKENHRVEAHRSLLSHPSFTLSIETAFAEMTHELLAKMPDTANDGAGRAFCISGAQQFIRTLKNLSEMPERPKPTVMRTLNHNA